MRSNFCLKIAYPPKVPAATSKSRHPNRFQGFPWLGGSGLRGDIAEIQVGKITSRPGDDQARTVFLETVLFLLTGISDKMAYRYSGEK